MQNRILKLIVFYCSLLYIDYQLDNICEPSFENSYRNHSLLPLPAGNLVIKLFMALLIFRL